MRSTRSHCFAGALPLRCRCSSQRVTVCAQAQPSQLSHAQPVQQAASQNKPALLPFTGLAQCLKVCIGDCVLEKVIRGGLALDNNHSGD